MISIPAILIDGALRPDSELPQGIAVFCDGENYVVYEHGDALPEVINDEHHPQQLK